MFNIIVDGIMEAVGFVFYIGLFYFIALLVQGVFVDSSRLWKLIKGLGASAFMALMISHNIGSPDCESVDYQSGICEQYNETEYEVSDAYKLRMFSFLFTLFGSPVIYASFTKRDLESDMMNDKRN